MSWIGVDLDGTLAHYDGWVDGLHIGEPIPLMLERVRQWLAEDIEVRIFTARVGARGCAKHSQDELTSRIQDWTEKHLGKRLPVTCEKDLGMIELWDDRCVQVITNTGRRVCEPE